MPLESMWLLLTGALRCCYETLVVLSARTLAASTAQTLSCPHTPGHLVSPYTGELASRAYTDTWLLEPLDTCLDH